MTQAAAKVGTVRARALADLAPASVDEAERSVEATIATGEGRQLGNVREELDVSGVNLERLNDGGPVLRDHRRSTDAVEGSVAPGSARVEGGAVRAKLVFQAGETWEAVRQGHLRQVSAGYTVDETEETRDADGTPRVIVRKWTPHEVSLVAVAAESGSRIRSAANDDPHYEERRQQIEQERQADIRALANRFDCDSGFVQRAIDQGWTLETTRAELFRHLVKESNEGMTHAHVRTNAGRDGATAFREAASDALAARMAGTEPETSAGRDAMGYSLPDMAVEMLRQQSDPHVSTMPRPQLIDRALGHHTTSDFAGVVADAANKAAMQAYRVRRSPLMQLAREVDLNDFKPANRIQLGQPPELQRVTEHGEFTRGSTDERGETIQLDTYGRVFALTRQLIVNDDVALFSDFIERMADAATILEAQKVAAVFTANSGSGPKLSDGETLFSSAHNNVASANNLDVAGMAEARKLLRRQTDVNSDEPLNLDVQYVVVNAEDETDAEKLVASITPTSPSDVNPFGGANIRILSDARLDGQSAWWTFAPVSQAHVIEAAFLSGARGPTIQTREGFDVDGIEVKVRHDFAAAPVDFRGAVRVPKP